MILVFFVIVVGTICALCFRKSFFLWQVFFETVFFCVAEFIFSLERELFQFFNSKGQVVLSIFSFAYTSKDAYIWLSSCRVCS